MSEKPPCPICHKPQDARYSPFCSKRCADVDLQR
ncbi:MAG: DNA gyrase inhibitor YacG, partial [Hyphomonadaceae bacterium]